VIFHNVCHPHHLNFSPSSTPSELASASVPTSMATLPSERLVHYKNSAAETIMEPHTLPPSLPRPAAPLGAIAAPTAMVLKSSGPAVASPNKPLPPHSLLTLQLAAGVSIIPLTNESPPHSSREKRKCTELKELHDVWSPTKAQEIQLQSIDIHIRRGAWTKVEEATLLANMEFLKSKHDTEDIAEYAKNKANVSKDFYRVLGSGISRPLQAVYRRFMRQMVDATAGKGKKYSDEDLEQVNHATAPSCPFKLDYLSDFRCTNTLAWMQLTAVFGLIPLQLQNLFTLHGNNFNKIGDTMGRSATSVRDRLRVLQGPKAKKWNLTEEARLTEVVLQLTGRSASDLVQSNVPWEAVAKKMSPRAPHQCQQKWLAKLAWKTCALARGVSLDWSLDDDKKLVEQVSSLENQDEAGIDWNLFAETFTGAVRTGYMLKQTWKRFNNRNKKDALEHVDIHMPASPPPPLHLKKP
jgi:hypothetical protein